MAGATHFNSDEEAVKWNNMIFGKTVSGQISNIFSKEDEILSKLYARIEQVAIGSKPIFVGMDKNMGKNELYKSDQYYNPLLNAFLESNKEPVYNLENFKC